MRSRAFAVVLTLLSLAAFTGAAFFIKISEQRIGASRAAVRAFDAAARSAIVKIADFDADATSASLVTLQSLATTDRARQSVEEAAARAADLTDIAPIVAHVTDARLAEQQASEEFELGFRKLDAIVLGAAGVFALFVVVALTLDARTSRADAVPSITQPAPSAETPVDAGASRVSSPPSAYTTARPAGPVLRKAAELCTNLGRVSDVEELRRLVGQAADVIDASGLIVWMSIAGGKELYPALAHGYSDEMLSRLPPLSRSADNAAARAFRSGQLQIVLARPGSSNGAVVAPLLTSIGCVGVVSAEIRGGGESSESVQALAAIVAAQLAMVVPAPAESLAQRTATGTSGI
jgi:hypothetical protein